MCVRGGGREIWDQILCVQGKIYRTVFSDDFLPSVSLMVLCAAELLKFCHLAIAEGKPTVRLVPAWMLYIWKP